MFEGPFAVDVTCLKSNVTSWQDFDELSFGTFLWLSILGLDSVKNKNKTRSKKLILRYLIS